MRHLVGRRHRRRWGRDTHEARTPRKRKFFPGRVVTAVTIQQDLDPYLTIKALAVYSGLSVSSLRSLLHHPTHPLPHYRIGEPGGSQRAQSGRRVRGAKILVRRSEFDRWMASYRQQQEQPPQDLDGILDQALARVRNHR